jgi:hypothetical protein
LPFACGICRFLHSITLQGCVAFVPHFTTTLSLHAVHSAAKTSATCARVVPSLHSVHYQPFVQLSNSFDFYSVFVINIGKTPLLNFTPNKSLHFVQSLPLLLPTQFSGMPCVMFTPGMHSSVSIYLKKKVSKGRRAPHMPSHYGIKVKPFGFCNIFLFVCILFYRYKKISQKL